MRKENFHIPTDNQTDKTDRRFSDANQTRCGFVVLLGAPNAGKSTLLNRFIGEKVSIVSPKVQTTRSRIRGIFVRDNTQIVFTDTPGIFKPKRRLDRAMVASAWAEAGDADCALLLVDVKKGLDEETKSIIKGLQKAGQKAVLVLNKIDLVTDTAALDELEARVKADLKIVQTFRISAANGTGTDALKQAVIDAMPHSPAYFPPGQWTDRWERFYVAEFIREQIFQLYKKEVPYSTYVEIEKFTEDLGPKNYIRAIIHVERESQKPILIGKGGSAIAELRKRAQKRIEEFLGRKYRLELNVVVSPNWRNDTKMLEEFGYIVRDEQ